MLFSFRPWWSQEENRTVVFYTEKVFNTLYMYVSPDAYPLGSTRVSWQGVNSTVSIFGSNPDYSYKSTYFLRVVPKFALFDTLSNKEFIVNTYAFSVKNNDSFTDLYIDEEVMGYANESNMYYRHYLGFPSATYHISVLCLEGEPILMIGLSSEEPMYPTHGAFDTFFYQATIEEVGGVNISSLTLTLADRINADPGCQSAIAGYYLDGGNTACTIYMGVYCSSTCVYEILLEISDIDESVEVFPKYLIENEFITDFVSVGADQYYYIPVNNYTGSMTLFLNKSWVDSYQNGNAGMTIYINNQSQEGIESWSYPTLNRNRYTEVSSNPYADQPEMLDICESTFRELCNNEENSCVVIIGVHNTDENYAARYRLKYFTQNNSLAPLVPIKDSIEIAGDYKYYYFSSNATVFHPQDYWEFLISLSIFSEGGDADMYLSLLDGRKPTQDDCDFASENMGPDDIIISQNISDFFK